MKIRILSCLTLAVAGLFSANAAQAAYVEADLSGYVNSYVSINAYTFPVGTTTGNQGTTIPFSIAPAPGTSIAGSWIAPSNSASLTVDLTSYNLTGQQSFYALLNNYFGTPGYNEYNVTVNATGGLSVTYSSIGGVNTRDYNQNAFTNTIAATTGYWFDNGIGQRLDVRTFVLPSEFAAQTLTSFVITQNALPNDDFDNAVFSGLTFSSDSVINLPGTPEPATWAMMFLGFLGVGLLGVRRRNQFLKASLS
jgi:hypothetical protein